MTRDRARAEAVDTEGSRSYRIIGLTLVGKVGPRDVAEPMPVLVDRTTLVPLRLANRWVVRHMRWQCMPNTLDKVLRAVALAYAWADCELRADLDDLLESGWVPEPAQIASLVMFLRTRVADAEAARAGDARVPTLATLAAVAGPVKAFLRWIVDPRLRGGSGHVPLDVLAAFRVSLDVAFEQALKRGSRDHRIRPLEPDEDERLRVLVSPVTDAEGRTLLPLRFRADNPWAPETRLRNFIAYQVAREHGLRRGEILKLCVPDLTSGREPSLRVLRRPNDPEDRRKNRPYVKRMERILPVSDLLRAAFRAYVTTRPPHGRMGVGTPYLIVTGGIRQLAINSLHHAIVVLRKVTGITDLRWHSLRHTWAEEIATDLLAQGAGEDTVIATLRELGGWAPGSSAPEHYIQRTRRREGERYLRERNRNRWTTTEEGNS